MPVANIPDISQLRVELPASFSRIKDTLSDISLPIQSLGQDFNNLNLQVLELTDSVNSLSQALISIPSNIKTRVNIEGDTAEEWLGKALGLGSMMGMGQTIDDGHTYWGLTNRRWDSLYKWHKLGLLLIVDFLLVEPWSGKRRRLVR